MSRDLWIGLLTTGVFTSACGGGGTSTPPPPPPPPPASPIMAKATPSGDGQSGTVGTVLPNPLRVIITQSGNPVVGTGVTWQIQPSGGSLNPTASQTGNDGIASTTVTLPAAVGTSTITATATGVTGSPQSFSETSTGSSLAVTVNVVNFAFQPANVTLKQGGHRDLPLGIGGGTPHRDAGWPQHHPGDSG